MVQVWFTERRQEVVGVNEGSGWLSYRDANAFPGMPSLALGQVPRSMPKETLAWLVTGGDVQRER